MDQHEFQEFKEFSLWEVLHELRKPEQPDQFDKLRIIHHSFKGEYCNEVNHEPAPNFFFIIFKDFQKYSVKFLIYTVY